MCWTITGAMDSGSASVLLMRAMHWLCWTRSSPISSRSMRVKLSMSKARRSSCASPVSKISGSSSSVLKIRMYSPNCRRSGKLLRCRCMLRAICGIHRNRRWHCQPGIIRRPRIPTSRWPDMSETTAVQSESGKAHRSSSPRLADFRVLVVPGLHGSGPEHWQSRWQRLYPSFERVEQDRWDTPDLPVWSQRLQDVLQKDRRPTLIVAHSFGCLTTVFGATVVAAAGAGIRHRSNSSNIVGALLVAPADPDKFNVVDAVSTRLPFPSLLIGSDSDPWMTAERAAYWAQMWGSDFRNIGALGHINAESGLGDWHDGQDLLKAFAARVG